MSTAAATALPSVALSVLGPGRESEAEDVAQEAFVRAFRALPGFRGESRLSTWLYRLAFNLAVDHRRAAGRRPATAGDESTAALPARDPASDPYRTSHRLPARARGLLAAYWIAAGAASAAVLAGLDPRALAGWSGLPWVPFLLALALTAAGLAVPLRALRRGDRQLAP